MQHIRQPNPWQHLEVFSDADLLAWLNRYSNELLPAAGRVLRDAGKDYRRTRQMTEGLAREAQKRGLIE